MKYSVSALIFNKKGQLLAVSRKYDHTDFGLPGGKVDEGETLEHALCREVKEETGLDIANCRQIFGNLSESKAFYSVTFLCSVRGELDDNVTLLARGEAVAKWTNWDEIERGKYGSYNRHLHYYYDKLISDGKIFC